MDIGNTKIFIDCNNSPKSSEANIVNSGNDASNVGKENFSDILEQDKNDEQKHQNSNLEQSTNEEETDNDCYDKNCQNNSQNANEKESCSESVFDDKILKDKEIDNTCSYALEKVLDNSNIGGQNLDTPKQNENVEQVLSIKSSESLSELRKEDITEKGEKGDPCEDLKFSTQEKPSDGNKNLHESCSYEKENFIASEVEGKTSDKNYKDKLINKNRNVNIQELEDININTKVHEYCDKDKNMNENFQKPENVDKEIEINDKKNYLKPIEHYDNSDSSALMELAELACKTNDTTPKEVTSLNDFDKLIVRDSPDLQKNNNICKSGISSTLFNSEISDNYNLSLDKIQNNKDSEISVSETCSLIDKAMVHIKKTKEAGFVAQIKSKEEKEATLILNTEKIPDMDKKHEEAAASEGSLDNSFDNCNLENKINKKVGNNLCHLDTEKDIAYDITSSNSDSQSCNKNTIDATIIQKDNQKRQREIAQTKMPYTLNTETIIGMDKQHEEITSEGNMDNFDEGSNLMDEESAVAEDECEEEMHLVKEKNKDSNSLCFSSKEKEKIIKNKEDDIEQIISTNFTNDDNLKEKHELYEKSNLVPAISEKFPDASYINKEKVSSKKESSSFKDGRSSSVIENNSQPLITEDARHSSEETEDDRHSSEETYSVMENNSQPLITEDARHSSEETEDARHSSEGTEDDRHSSEEKSYPIKDSPSIEKYSLIKENVLPTRKNIPHNISKENISYSLEKEKNLHSSTTKNASFAEKEKSSESSLIKNILQSSETNDTSYSSLAEDNSNILVKNSSPSLTKSTNNEKTLANSSSCPKIFIRKDLHDPSSYDYSRSLGNINTEENKYFEDSHKLTELTANKEKRPHLSLKENNISHKKMKCILNMTYSGDSSEEENLVIDEERPNLSNLKLPLKEKQKNSKMISKQQPEGNNCNPLTENVKNQNDKDANFNLGKSNSNAQSIESSAVEFVDLVEDEASNESSKTPIHSLESDKNFICKKCKEIWKDEILKLLFEGNESVTVNSRITYGAIICMNIYVSVHYPNIKEQALIGLLDRADLAKNLGSIQVSLLNNWLVALIKNRKISCCDPFRPVYRLKVPTKDRQSDKMINKETANKEFYDKQKLLKRKRQRIQASTNQVHSGLEVIDNDIEENIAKDEENLNRFSILSKKHNIKKIGSILKLGTLVLDMKNNVQTNGKAYTKQFSKSNPISYSIIQRERESLSRDLLDAYDELYYEPKLTEEEVKIGKRKILTNKEILCIHSIFILNAKEIFLNKYYRFLFQLLYHRECILLIPDGKTLVQSVEDIRKEHNRLKSNLTRNKSFLCQSWDADNIFSVPFAKPLNKKNECNVKVRDILSVFCSWKNRTLLSNESDSCVNLKEEILKLYENKVEINDCFGLCVRLYANYCRLLFCSKDIENMKTKIFMNLLYLPNNYLSSIENTLIFDPEINYFPPGDKNSADIIDCFEKQTKKASGQVKRSYLDTVIDSKLQQAKKLKTDLLNSVKTPKAINLIESYAKLKNELNYLEVEPVFHPSFNSAEDSQEEFLKSSYSPEVKLIIAKLRVANVDAEYIPIILEKIFHNIFKKEIPSL